MTVEKSPTVTVCEDVAALFLVFLGVLVLVEATPVPVALAVTVADETPDG